MVAARVMPLQSMPRRALYTRYAAHDGFMPILLTRSSVAMLQHAAMPRHADAFRQRDGCSADTLCAAARATCAARYAVFLFSTPAACRFVATTPCYFMMPPTHSAMLLFRASARRGARSAYAIIVYMRAAYALYDMPYMRAPLPRERRVCQRDMRERCVDRL